MSETTVVERPLRALWRRQQTVPRPVRRGGRHVDAQQGRRRRARAADRRGRRRRRPRRRLVRRRACSASSRATPSWPGSPRSTSSSGSSSPPREYVARRALARPRPGRRARAAGRGLRPRAAPRPRLARGPAAGDDAGDPQRRRQPARAVPRRRRPGDPADRAQRAARRRGLRRRVVAAAGARLPADPGHRRPGRCVFQRRLEPLYARVRGGRRRPVRRRSRPTSAGIATIKAFTAEDRERDRVAGGLARPTGRPTSTRSAPRPRSCR